MSVRTLIIPLFAALLFVSCERGPTDFDAAPTTSTHPLNKIVMYDAVQTVAINGQTIASYPVNGTNLLAADSVISAIGRIDESNGDIRLHLKLDLAFPDFGINVLRGFDPPQLRGFVLDVDSLAVPTDEEGYHTSEGCPNTRANLRVAQLVLDTSDCNHPFYRWDNESEIPATTELQLRWHPAPEGEGSVLDGTIAVRATMRMSGGSLLFYDLVGRLEIE